MNITHVFSLLGGLALFLYGMDLMGKSLERQAGSRLQKILSRLTDNPFKGFLLGLAVTAVIQSSSATTVMVVGFVNSGIMQLHQAAGIIMGSNVGTTVTSWLLSLTGLEGDSLLIQLFKPSTFSPLLAFIGILLFMFGGEKKKGIGGILIGFAILMTGMTAMSDSAIPIIMGQNIGTCATALISSVGTNKNARRAAMIHLYFNVIGVTVFLVLFYGLNAVFHFSFITDVIAPWGIAVVHTAFNLGATALLLPFTGLLERLACLTIPDDEKKEKFALLDERLLNTPSVAVEQARSVTSEMAEMARSGVLQAMSLTHRWDADLAQKVREQEKQVDRYEDALGTYLVKLSGHELNHDDSQQVNTLLHTISDFERISDYSVNLLLSAQEIHDKEITFSADAQEELSVLEDVVQDLLNRTTEAFRQNDLHLASKVEPMESVLGELVRAIKARHIARLQAGSCSIHYGFVLDDLLTSYSRICAHCSNVAVAQIEVAQDSFDTHAYLSDLRHNKAAEESKAFQRRVDRYRARYRFPQDEAAGGGPDDKKEEF